MMRLHTYVKGGQGVFFVLLPLAYILCSLMLGAYHISPTHVYQILVADFTGVLPPDVTAMEVSMVYDVRLPRILGAVVAGCGLSVAGGVFQALFGNPLASPYTLGVSSGTCDCAVSAGSGGADDSACIRHRVCRADFSPRGTKTRCVRHDDPLGDARERVLFLARGPAEIHCRPTGQAAADRLLAHGFARKRSLRGAAAHLARIRRCAPAALSLSLAHQYPQHGVSSTSFCACMHRASAS